MPILSRDIEKADDLDKEIKASGFDENMTEEERVAFETIVLSFFTIYILTYTYSMNFS